MYTRYVVCLFLLFFLLINIEFLHSGMMCFLIWVFLFIVIFIMGTIIRLSRLNFTFYVYVWACAIGLVTNKDDHDDDEPMDS
jgi:hypothetical protein